ncbi:hypothetical protein [Aureimonas sp. ME7]|uniref:hypothetical protein n=1 Tax=Aureimonas sp. ME7 TaxID=2744252 RepID=UPI0015FE057B|nr:hypothetical protein [Aureimonas sp. ME7]
MSCVDAIIAAYRRAMDRHGEAVVIQSAPVANSPTPPLAGPSRARIMEYQPVEVAGGITAGMRKAIILHEDLASTPYASGIVKGARILWNGRTLTVAEVDNGTRRLAGVPIAYQCRLAGA